MATIAVLGMGLLGIGFAENLLAKGHIVRVWNRTASKCAPVVALGAHGAETPADPVQGAERVHLVLTADTAVDSVIAAMRPALGADVPIVDHSTNLPTAVATRSDRLRAEGVRYLHAPVFMAPANSKAGTGLMLISGPTTEVEALRPALETMTGRLHFAGERSDKAAGIKLIGNGLMFMMSGAMGDLFHLAEATGVSAEEVMGLFQTFAPTPVYLGQRVLNAGTAPASFELTMARKDTALMIESAGADTLTVLPAVAAAMDRAIEAGLGSEDYAIFNKPGR